MEPRQDPKAYRQTEGTWVACGALALTSLGPQQSADPGSWDTHCPVGAPTSPRGWWLHGGPTFPASGAPGSRRETVRPGAPRTHKPHLGPSPPGKHGKRDPGNNALRVTDFPLCGRK